MAKIKVVNVAKALGVSPETVRVGLQQGIYPFGTAIKKEGSSTYTYVFYPQKVKEVLGEISNDED